jgi:hypothetical protein
MGPEVVKRADILIQRRSGILVLPAGPSRNPAEITRLKGMTRVLYESANGDVWRLVRDPQSGFVKVEHKPNASSGGRPSLIEIGKFLRAGANGPEHQALLQLIGSLVDD